MLETVEDLGQFPKHLHGSLAILLGDHLLEEYTRTSRAFVAVGDGNFT